ncbi:MAG: Holliday junction branch migration protein RuvA [Alphaproteobacteria bacterium]
MIGKLRGIVDSIGQDWLIVDVGGVGYEVSCPARVLSNIPAIGQPVTLIIETHVREDQIRLFGFLSDAERSWFRLLQNVQGVGTKVALSILGVLGTVDLANAITLQDKAFITRAPGVGPKVAQRIVAELKDKAPALLTAGGVTLPATDFQAGGSPGGGSSVSDAVSALVNLGYSASEASAAIAVISARADGDLKTEELIRLGLKELAR